mmetsp:Transcript_22486/g.27741  ORF Transcript_22486/g.27741 Transcript_22486/m.27741 type:complete len:117 (-) Transcript_22486:298-648(-)
MMTTQTKIEIGAQVSVWRYASHPDSLLTRYFGMCPRVSSWLLPFKKHYTCKHMFGCFENLLRKFAKTAAIYIVTKSAFSFIFGANIDDAVLSLAKDNWTSMRSWHADDLNLLWFGA